MPQSLSQSEVPDDEKVICLYPGCEREAVPGPDTGADWRRGAPPRYCDIEEHNALTTYQELRRREQEGGTTESQIAEA